MNSDRNEFEQNRLNKIKMFRFEIDPEGDQKNEKFNIAKSEIQNMKFARERIQNEFIQMGLNEFRVGFTRKGG